ncbi:TPA: hypothetical protein N0F65_000509 [Lagenidium giganteum]|uniref:Ribosome quality control complex subunit 2 n=1 Tax=Lagenidium giganteum TaxID=4803 RepID=A0AAV2YVA4_9STRA|nr:TPA: hypothetical protein N0F65_000509 [Lagenidium giganteum]
MPKTRMSIDDIHAMVGSIRSNVLNMRVTNIYDLDGSGGGGKSKTYILKLHQPPFPKVFLLLESGIRFHTSKYARDASSATATLPSQFTMKLRKHLRGKRLVGLTQLEGDRVVDLTFGSDQLQCHLILELYASGNIILTDDQYTILSLLRTHKFDENVKMAVRQVYPIHVLENKPATDAIQDGAALVAFIKHWFEEQDATAAAAPATGKGKKKQQTLKQVLLTKDSPFGSLGPVIVEHCIANAQVQASMKLKGVADVEALGSEALDTLAKELCAGFTLLERLQSEQVKTIVEEDAVAKTNEGAQESHGFIIMKERAQPTDPQQFDEFTPFLYAQHRNREVRGFETFDEAVDEYFSHFETQMAEVERRNAQAVAENKLAKLRKNQKQQLDQLMQQEAKNFRHAQLLEINQQDVENVLLVVRSALANGMDWKSLEELIKYEQKNGNPVASLIHELDLAKNRISILLCDEDEDEDEDGDEEDRKAHVVWIDLSMSALANAREKYSSKKKATEKAKKAAEATDKAIEHAEKKTQKVLQKQQMKRTTIYQRRKVLWFERFHWFISSEGYLVIAGKDAHQNEMLVKRYLRKGDLYVHADLHGAATCVVRNRVGPGGVPGTIPVATLEQAGCMSVCRSNAWTNQVIAGAYWVNADQVSKTAPTGEYLTTGSFMIRGKKNYINPSRLEMGLAIVFRLEDSSASNHATDDADTDFAVESEEQRANDQGNAESRVDQEEEGDAAEQREDKTEEEERNDPEDDAEVAEGADEREAQPTTDDVAEEQTVQVDGEDDQEETDDKSEKGEPEAPSRRGNRPLTAAERRRLKKGRQVPIQTGDDDESLKEQPKNEKKAKQAVAKGKGKGSEPVAAPQKNVRGKKGKLKKMKKYADQDEEDRRLRMELLGHVQPKQEEEEHENDDNDEDAEQETTKRTTEKKEKKASEEYIREQREKKEKFLEQEEEEVEGVDFFDAFTGSPQANDVVLHAMPMCAPYSGLTKYKYKVKLTPGSQKKGKAVKQAMEYFLSMNMKQEKDAAKANTGKDKDAQDDNAPDVDPLLVQRELMKCIPENELVNCMVGPVKLSAPGMAASASTAKKGGAANRGSKKKK